MKNWIYTLENIAEVAADIVRECSKDKIWLLQGEMGAGKTTLTSEICKQLNVIDSVSSPTFSIVNEYLANEGHVVYHFDFYRLVDEYEAMDIGVEEYFYSGHLCILEWASKIENLLPHEFVELHITIIDEFTRQLHLQYHG